MLSVKFAFLHFTLVLSVCLLLFYFLFNSFLLLHFCKVETRQIEISRNDCEKLTFEKFKVKLFSCEHIKMMKIFLWEKQAGSGRSASIKPTSSNCAISVGFDTTVETPLASQLVTAQWNS